MASAPVACLNQAIANSDKPYVTKHTHNVEVGRTGVP